MRGSLSTCFNRCVNTSQIKVQRLALLTLALLSPQVRANISAPANESNKQASVALWSNANPTALEQDALEHINRLRHNPVTELTRIFARYSLDPKITALLKPYQQRGLSGQLESLDITAARLLATISAEYDSRKKVLLMSAAPLCLYPLFKQRATSLREVFYSYEVASKVANSSAIFNPIYPGTQQPPTYLFSPIILFSNTYSDMPLSSWSGPNATNGIVTFGPYGGNETMVTWTDLSTEGGIDLDAWCAFLFLSQDYPALFAQGPYTPSLALGNGRLAGVDISNRTGSPGNGDLILTIDIGDPQAFTSGSDLPYGPVNTVFITGVVYNDLNVNGVYDSGEGDARVIEKFTLYRTYHGSAMNPVIQSASIAAWRDENHVAENRRLYTDKFAQVVKILEPVLPVSLPDAAFYLWIRTPISDTDFAQNLYRDYNVTVLPGSFLARTAQGINPGENFVRLALVATTDETIEAAKRIAEFTRKLSVVNNK